MSEKQVILKSVKKRLKKIINKKDKNNSDFMKIKNLKAIELIASCF